MLIKLINHDAEKALLSLLEQANKQNITGGGALYFNRSMLKARPSEEDFLLTVRLSIEDKSSALYFFENGDVVITWKGMQKSTLADLCERLYERYAPDARDGLHAYFDLQAQGDALRRLCKLRAEEPALAVRPSAPVAVAARPPAIAFPDELMTLFRAALQERESREAPEILVVEDQAFSKKLLTGMLAQDYKVHGAGSAREATELYCANAPDIVFLDIELPDTDGHQLAAAIRGLDPHAYIVMVTGNNAAEDVLRAKENGVKGFIVKPYNKQKIQDSVDTFMRKYR